MGNRIEAYISHRNLIKLEELRQLVNEKGYSRVLDKILTARFYGGDEREKAIISLNKIIEGQNLTIRELQYENRTLKIKEKPPKPQKENKNKKDKEHIENLE